MRVYGSTFYNINPTKHYLKSNFKSAGASINNAFSFDRVEFCARPKNTDAMPVMTNDKSCSEQLFKNKDRKL